MSSMSTTYRWPAEWESHRATWVAWPHQKKDWPGKFPPIPWVYTEIVRHLSRSEIVGMLVNDGKAETAAKAALAQAGVDLARIEFHQIATDRVWTRDSGPVMVKAPNGTAVALDWRFNAWAKYRNHKLDDAVSAQLAERNHWRRIEPMFQGRRIILEGGSIDGNGRDVLLTTEECLLSKKQQRNPGFSRGHYEQVFADFLGIKKTLWLNRGIVGDDTHGHIDDLARFVRPNAIVAVVEPDEGDDNHVPLRENFERLAAMTDLNGSKFEIIPLPMPDPVVFDGQRLPASYANFYIANECVLVPTFNSPQDRVALGVLAELFPNRKVIGIHAVDLVWGLGTLHCLTQQEPA